MSLGSLWAESKSAVRELADVSERTWRDTLADGVLARQEFAAAGDLTREGVRELLDTGASRSVSGNILGGVGLAGGLAASFVFPTGRGARVVGSGKGVARRAAAGLGDGLEGEAGRAIRPSGADAGADVAAAILRDAGVPVAEPEAFGAAVARLEKEGKAGGFTWDPRSGVTSFDAGFATAVVKGYTFKVPLTEFTSADAVRYLGFVPEGQSKTVAQRLSDDPRNAVGAWVAKVDGVDHVWMDVSSVVDDLDTALRIGGALREKAVFDFNTYKDVFLIDNPAYMRGGSRFTPDALRQFGFEGPAVGAEAVVAPSTSGGASRLGLPPSLLRGEGGFGADISGVRARELAETLAERHLDSPTGLSALDPREIASVLENLPEFSDFVRMYRATVVDGMKSSLDRRSMRGDALIDFAGLSGLTSPRYARGINTSVSFPASVQGSQSEAIRGGAENLAIRIRNMGAFVTDDAYDPIFYVEFNRILSKVSKETGMPIEVLTSALASASAQAAPYDEVLRFARIAPLVQVKNGVADIIPGSLELLGTDNFAITALRGLVDTINNPDFLTVKPYGQAMKTSAYAYNRLDPLYRPVYVADTVDGLGQFLIAGGKAGTDKAQSSIVNQIAGRTLASVYEVAPSPMQEALWSHIRVARDGLKTTITGKPTSEPIAPSFTGARGSVDDILIEAVRRMDSNVLALARQNRAKFYDNVKSGEVPAWVWDEKEGKALISSSDYLIPSDQRLTSNGRGPALQNQMLGMVESLGPELRARLLALTAATGISLPLLLSAMGESSYDIPDAALTRKDA